MDTEGLILGITIIITVFVPLVVIFGTNKDEDIPAEPVIKQPAELPEHTENPKQTVFTQTAFPQYEYIFIYLNLVDTNIVEQIANICTQQSAEGWDYYRLETSVIKHTPGCFGVLLGLKDFYTYHQYIVFRRPFSKKNTSLESSNII